MGIGPNRNTAVAIDPTRSLTVTGPLADVEIRQLVIGGLLTNLGQVNVTRLTASAGLLNQGQIGGSGVLA